MSRVANNPRGRITMLFAPLYFANIYHSPSASFETVNPSRSLLVPEIRPSPPSAILLDNNEVASRPEGPKTKDLSSEVCSYSGTNFELVPALFKSNWLVYNVCCIHVPSRCANRPYSVE